LERILMTAPSITASDRASIVTRPARRRWSQASSGSSNCSSDRIRGSLVSPLGGFKTRTPSGPESGEGALELCDSAREESGGPEDSQHGRRPRIDLVDESVLANDDLSDIVPAQFRDDTTGECERFKSLSGHPRICFFASSASIVRPASACRRPSSTLARK